MDEFERKKEFTVSRRGNNQKEWFKHTHNTDRPAIRVERILN